MGEGLIMQCNNCNKKYEILLGDGMMSFALNFTKVLYICPKCGNWINRNEKNRDHMRLKAFGDAVASKDANIVLETMNKFEKKEITKQKLICKKCNTLMNAFENLDEIDAATDPQNKRKNYFEKRNSIQKLKLLCPDCNSELFPNSNLILWD